MPVSTLIQAETTSRRARLEHLELLEAVPIQVEALLRAAASCAVLNNALEQQMRW